MKKKIIIFGAIFLIIVLASVGFYMIKKSTEGTETKKMQVYTVPESEKIFINGSIMPQDSESIYLDASKGDVNKVSVNNGQIVKKGQTLFTYKNDTVTDQIAQIQQQVDSSKTQKKQLEAKEKEAKSTTTNDLTYLGVGSSTYKDQIETLKVQIDSYEDQIKTLKAKETTTVIAPIEGRVTLNDKESQTEPYVTIDSTSFYVKGSVSEKQQPKVKADQKVEILIISTGKTAIGKITSVGDRPTESSSVAAAAASTGGSSNVSNYDVDIAFDSQEGLTNGFHVQATLKLAGEAIKIPKSSILKEGDKSYVFKSVDNKLVKQEVSYEDSEGEEVVIKSGLGENDSVISNPTADMEEGNVVE